MPHGTASNQLRKILMFELLRKYGDNFCFKCGAEIETSAELSVEHKIPWLYAENPKEMFFDLSNIAFSHLACNRPSPENVVRSLRFQGEKDTSWCSTCQAFLTKTLFYKDASRWDGLNNVCKSCHNIKIQRRRKERKYSGVV